MTKKKPGPKRPTGGGGFRLPSVEKLRAYGTEQALSIANKVELIQNTRPQKLLIYKKDLDRLRVIGKGNYRRGFYRMLDLAHEIHLENRELLDLRKIGKGNARVGLLELINRWKKENPSDTL